MALALWGGFVVGQQQLPAEFWSGGFWFIGGTEVTFALLLAAHAALATKVSYRWFDAFLLLVPMYGVVWSVKILYRVAALPRRDWEPPPGELRGGEEADVAGQCAAVSGAMTGSGFGRPAQCRRRE